MPSAAGTERDWRAPASIRSLRITSPLKTYRVYCFDAEHNVLTADWLEAASDEDAIAKAHAQGFGTKCELWDGRRMVAELDEDDRREA